MNFFILSTHPQESELASLPPRNLLVDTADMSDPSSIFSVHHVDWWNSPGGDVTAPAAYSDEETAAFDDWLKVANEVRIISHNCTYTYHV